MISASFIPKLKRTFNYSASALSMTERKLPCVSYQSRFLEAYKLAGSPARKVVAEVLGISVQAVGPLITGTTGTLQAEPSAKAADFLEVDHHWLATGEGRPRPDRAWPFELFDKKDWMLLDDAQREEIENSIAGAIQRARLRNGTNQS